MFRQPDDAIRDALALTEAVHNGDLTAVRVLLDCGEPRAIATALASVCDDLIADLSEWCRLEPAAMLERMRASHAPGDRP